MIKLETKSGFVYINADYVTTVYNQGSMTAIHLTDNEEPILSTEPILDVVEKVRNDRWFNIPLATTTAMPK